MIPLIMLRYVSWGGICFEKLFSWAAGESSRVSAEPDLFGLACHRGAFSSTPPPPLLSLQGFEQPPPPPGASQLSTVPWDLTFPPEAPAVRPLAPA